MAELDPAGLPAARVTVRKEGDVLVLSIAGELDMISAEQVRFVIEDALAGETDRVVVETGELEFMDSSGIALLLSVARKVREVELREPSPIVRRLIQLTGLDQILHVVP